jgi:pimeloyl-ACP methyl ester carboxylesterase
MSIFRCKMPKDDPKTFASTDHHFPDRQRRLRGLHGMFSQAGGSPAFFGMKEEAEKLAKVRAAAPGSRPDLRGADYVVAGERQLLKLLTATLLILTLTACVSTPRVPYEKSLEPLVLGDPRDGNLHDARGRFRQIYCAVNDDHGEQMPDYRPCNEALVEIGVEPQPADRPVSLAGSEADLLVLMVPGLGHQCIKNWLDYDNAAPFHVAEHGYEAEVIEVDALSGSAANARQIRDFIMALPPEKARRPLVLIGFSKGAPDSLEALVEYPEVAEKVVAMVAFAGAVGGSALAEDAKQSQLNLLAKLPGNQCEEGDSGALESLKPAVREAWLKEHELPRHIRYYSVVSFPDPERISLALKPSWRKLGKLVDARNDSQLVFYDQVIPGSSLVAFTNADHWAMAVPVARQHWLASSTFATHNDFPREVMFEALLRFIEEDLSRQRMLAP